MVIAARLTNQAFPKVCRKCQKVYRDEFEFFSETLPVPHVRSEIRAVEDDPDEPEDFYLEVYRNCKCGSTLMERFHSRRDMSPAGMERRKAFEDMVDVLEGAGYSRPEGQEMLRNFLRHFVASPE